MTVLANLQRRFARDLRGDTGAIRDAIADGPSAGRDELIGVYRHAYGARLAEALANDFPATAACLGQAAFGAAAHAYIAAHPSRHPSIRWLGAHFAAHLAARGQAPVGELAAFEWALGLAFDGSDADPAMPEHLAALPPEAWEKLRPCFHPTAQRVTQRFAAAAAWKAWREMGEITETPPPLPAPLPFIVWRSGLEVQYREMAGGEEILFDRIAGGLRFAEALDGLDPGQAVAWLAGWCAAVLVRELSCDDST